MNTLNSLSKKSGAKQMNLQMKREALEKINRQANEMPLDSGTAMVQ